MFKGTSFHPDIITNAEGQTLTTATGHQMLDWTSGQMSTLIGHANPEIVETIHKHAQNLDHLFSGMLSPPVISLAKRLTALTPRGLDKAFFLSTGGESNEAAIRLAKFYTGKFEIVGLASSWHGVTSGAIAAQYHAGRSGYGPNMPGNLALPTPDAYRSIFRHADGSYDWKTELDYGFDLVDKQSCGSLAAVILEPILSSGGMLVLPPGYLKAVRVHCDKRHMLLIVDEAQTGIGRAGDMFAFQHFEEDEGVVPDILTLSKTRESHGMCFSGADADKSSLYSRQRPTAQCCRHERSNRRLCEGESILVLHCMFLSPTPPSTLSKQLTSFRLTSTILSPRASGTKFWKSSSETISLHGRAALAKNSIDVSAYSSPAMAASATCEGAG